MRIPQNKAYLQLVAWLCYLCVWAGILLCDYHSRPSSDLLHGGASETAAWILALTNLSGFGILVISGTRAVRNLTARILVIVLHLVASVLLTFYVLLWYAVDVLGETL